MEITILNHSVAVPQIHPYKPTKVVCCLLAVDIWNRGICLQNCYMTSGLEIVASISESNSDFLFNQFQSAFSGSPPPPNRPAGGFGWQPLTQKCGMRLD